jgi:hypothetical protein
MRGIVFDIIVRTFDTLAELPNAPEIATGKTEFSGKEFALISKIGYLASGILDWTKALSTELVIRKAEDVMASFVITIIAGRWDPEDAPLERRQWLAKLTMCVNESLGSYLTCAEDTLTQPFNAALQAISRVGGPSDAELTLLEAVGLVRVAEMHLGPRRLFVTSRGHIGIGPDIVTAGDVCCIVSGGELPYILRPYGPSAYLLVGESYIDGVMDGEAVELDSWEDIVLW